MGLALPRLEGRPSFPPGAGTALGKGPALSITEAWRTPTSITAMQSPEKLIFSVFFPQIGGGRPDTAQPEPVVHRWSIPRRLVGAAEALPPLGIADVGTVLGVPIPLKNRLQLLPDGAGASSSSASGSAGTSSAHRLVHHQRRSCRPHEVVTRPVGCPCKEIGGDPKHRPQATVTSSRW